MNRIKNIVFDFGGVIITLSPETAEKRFGELGLPEASRQLNSYTQSGIFGDVELGKISDSEFIRQLSLLCQRDLSYEECRHAWLGYCKELPQRNLDALEKLRSEGYRLIMLSNTNPFMMSWAMSADFDGKGHPVSHYFDGVYLSYQMGVMKPDPTFFSKMMAGENILPAETLFVDDGPRNVEVAGQMGIHTYCPDNGTDWTKDIYNYL